MEKVRLTAANMNLTKPQLLNKEGGRWRVVLPQTLVLRRRLSTIKPQSRNNIIIIGDSMEYVAGLPLEHVNLILKL